MSAFPVVICMMKLMDESHYIIFSPTWQPGVTAWLLNRLIPNREPETDKGIRNTIHEGDT